MLNSQCRFSMPQEAVAGLIRAGLRNPFRVNVSVEGANGEAVKQKTPASLCIEYMVVPSERKMEQLLAILQSRQNEKGIVYLLTCASVEFMAAVLPQLPGGATVPVLMMHGGMKQPKVSYGPLPC
jgi:ATP-dependent RNA helicase DDX55/SPB4